MIIIFKANFKAGIIESVFYFGEWAKKIAIYDTQNKDGETLFLIKPKCKIYGEYIWLSSNLFN